MPEGPEIIITTQYLKSKLKKKKINSVQILSGRYTHETLKGLNFVTEQHTPLTIQTIDSKGKFMWIRMTDNSNKTIFLLSTFGLTGRWSFREESNSRIKFVIQSNTDPNKKYDLYYVDQRNFGTVEFTDNENDLQKKLNKLAPDVLKTNMSDADLLRMINQFIAKTRKNTNLVKVLMDQGA